jgi:hypothetical protein
MTDEVVRDALPVQKAYTIEAAAEWMFSDEVGQRPCHLLTRNTGRVGAASEREHEPTQARVAMAPARDDRAHRLRQSQVKRPPSVGHARAPRQAIDGRILGGCLQVAAAPASM